MSQGDHEIGAMAPPTMQEKNQRLKEAAMRNSPSTDRRHGPPQNDNSRLSKALEKASEVDFTNDKEAQEWESKYKERFSKKRNGDQILHTLAKNETKWSDEKIKKFLDWILGRHHELLNPKNKDNYTPFHLAFMYKNDAFIEAVLEKSGLVNISNVLSDTCQYGNSLHVAIKYMCDTRLIELMMKPCANVSEILSNGKTDTLDTPLHLCIKMDLEGGGDELGDGDGDSSDSGSEPDTCKENAKEEKLQEDEIASYVRSYCVRNFSREMIMECLYAPGQERHIEFDLGGLPHPSISEDYLKRLSSHLRFESILKYVALPKLTMEKAISRKNIGRLLPKKGLSDLVDVFDWLHKNGVRKIVKVMVIDDGDPGHADASIEKAVGRFGVEIWDWKRLDLSTEVIQNCSKDVKEISLYSTGNNAVLMGWASEQGLPNIKKFPKGLEDKDRLETYISAFKTSIQTDTINRVKVQHTMDNKSISFASGFKSGEEQFQPLLRSSIDPQDPQPRPVKIAIIDDGVDASLASLDDKIAMGESFCPYPNSTDLVSPYYVPSGKHGTCMAALICKICPHVKLYVARLDERPAVGSGQRQITIKSAADAIRWASSYDVDIISMSWTIETQVIDSPDMKNFRAAVEAAEQKGIIMFCSTSDQGNSTNDNCYPGSFNGPTTIGGATDTGDALAWVNVRKVRFLLPGSNVPFYNNEGRVVSYESGSSVATAAASGLAGLLLFCSWLLKENDSPLKGNQKMEKAFSEIALHGNFPRVQKFFDQRFRDELKRAEKDSGAGLEESGFYDIASITWNDNCRQALSRVMEEIMRQ
ncbi:intracellular serine protease [Trichoderma arundinaceum]|uniref:Intracellular serine protease n=1 Tax=Trichoderma arundinaceum TaxID=490622 RepID=A0A395NUT0_TRIAR|nr:intracellular serine protease [Trichoderma arundinaceum]